jgi:hypothetical protein
METNMSETTRRNFAAVLAGGAVVAGLTTSAQAYQGNMEHALSSLYAALAALREAEGNKGGHRATAMNLIQQAITETQAGIEFGDTGR